MARLLGGTGLSHGTGSLQAVPMPNGPVHNLDTSAGEASTPALHAKTRAIGLTLSEPHYMSIDGTPATTDSWKVPGGFTFWPLPKSGAVSVSILPESGAADVSQCVAEWQ